MRVELLAESGVHIADSVTSFRSAEGRVLVSGSHGGKTAVLFAIALGAKAAIFNDAGVGKGSAGIAGLRLADRFGMAAAAVDHQSARVGDGRDTYESGRISFYNRCADYALLRAGMGAAEAVALFAKWTPPRHRLPRPASPAGRPAMIFRKQPPRILGVDSASQIDGRFVGAIVLTGSHGGSVGGRAVRASVVAAIFNDAGVGKDQAGIAKLALLEKEGVPAATVDCFSAGIGSARETYASGTLSHVNGLARLAGWQIFQPARDAVHALAEALASPDLAER